MSHHAWSRLRIGFRDNPERKARVEQYKQELLLLLASNSLKLDPDTAVTPSSGCIACDLNLDHSKPWQVEAHEGRRG